MISSNPKDMLFITQSGQDRLSRLGREGTVHVVRVLNRLEGDRARVSVDGKPFVARIPPLYIEGSSFKAVVIRNGGLLTLIPQGPVHEGATSKQTSVPVRDLASPVHLAARLGLPQSPEVLSLINFYSAMGNRLEPARIRKLAALAARFPGKEEDAAEAAAMLDSQGEEPDERKISELASLLRGGEERSDHNPDDSGETLIDGLSENKSGARWVVIPFSRNTGMGYAGSLRFLMEEKTGMVRGMRIGAVIDGISVRCELDGENPSFSVNPQIPAVILEKTEVYFKSVLSAAGIHSTGSVQHDPVGTDLPHSPLDVRV